MYDPKIGRWISEDPVGFQAADANLYRYVRNNSINATDPSGLDSVPTEGTCALAPELLQDAEITLGFHTVLGPAGGRNGAFVWMVTWDVNPKANKDRGGWVIQHVKGSLRVSGTDFKDNSDGDWYEAWRVTPDKTEVEEPKPPKDLTLAFLKQIDKETKSVPKYNDMFWHTKYGVETAGRIVASGEAYYFPDLDLPNKFKRDNPDTGAGHIRSMKTDGNESVIDNLFEKHKHSGVVKRSLTGVWKQGTDVEVTVEPEAKK
jgi:uncharacterized protein RhaS with RHS repeats